MKLLHLLQKRRLQSCRILTFSTDIPLADQRAYIWTLICEHQNPVLYIDTLQRFSQANPPPKFCHVLCLIGEHPQLFDIMQHALDLLPIQIVIFDSVCVFDTHILSELYTHIYRIFGSQEIDIYLLFDAPHRPLFYADQVILISAISTQFIPTDHNRSRR